MSSGRFVLVAVQCQKTGDDLRCVGGVLYWAILKTEMTASMNRKIITVESRRSPALLVLQRVMRMVPDRDKGDKRLQRLLVFRLQHDGEAATCEYLMRHIRRYIRRPEPCRFYDFLIQGEDRDQGTNRWAGRDPEPPGAA